MANTPDTEKLKEALGKIGPQYYNEVGTSYRILHGNQYAPYSTILGPDGNPLFTSTNPGAVADADALAKITDVDTKLQNIINGTSPATTQVTGRKVEETLLERGIYSNSNNFFFTPPEWSKIAIVSLRVHAVTGNTPALNTTVVSRAPLIADSLRIVGNEVTNQTRDIFVFGDVDNGVDLELSNGTLKMTKLPPLKEMRVYYGISGTFNAGEGFDMEMGVQYL